jgi:hypothetical protein
MNWGDIRAVLKEAPLDALIGLIKKLYDLSDANKALVRTILFPSYQDIELLEKSRIQVTQAIYPSGRSFPGLPHFGDSRKVINAYLKASGDVQGTIDLMLTHVELGTNFTNDFGDIDEPFYQALVNMLNKSIELMLKNPEASRLYSLFQPRYERLRKDSGQIGWGFGDEVGDLVEDLRGRMQG